MPATKPAANSSAHVRTVVLDRYRTIWRLKEYGSSGPIRSLVAGGPERQRCPPPAGLRRSLDALVGGNDPKGWSRHGLPESRGSHYLTITVKPVPASSSTWAHSPPTITNQTSPHFAEALPDHRRPPASSAAAPLPHLGPWPGDGRAATVHIDSGVQVDCCDPRSPGSAAPTKTPTACSATPCPRVPT